jgi:hypothetical protein
MRLHSSRLGQVFSLILAATVCVTARAQTNIALSIYGAFSNSATPGNDNFFRESPATSAGGLFEFRHLSSPIFGWEASYSFHRANEVYDNLIFGIPAPSSCGNPVCPTPTYAVSANAQQLTAGWVPSVHTANFRPFAPLGVGPLLNRPISGQSGTTNSSQPAFVYGGGLDWGTDAAHGTAATVSREPIQGSGHCSSEQHVPNIGFIHTAEPAVGVSYRF